MAQIECGRGHLYDPEKYPTCPYCKNNQQITVAAAGRTALIRVTDTSRTAPLSGTPVTASSTGTLIENYLPFIRFNVPKRDGCKKGSKRQGACSDMAEMERFELSKSF